MALVGQYFCKDGSSGTSPTTVADSGPATTVPLTMTFGGTASWVSLGTGNGLSFDASGSSQAASATLSGTKYQTNFSGATAMVVEFVSDVSATGCVASLADSTNANQAFALVVNSSGAWLDCFIINGWYRFPYTTGRQVYHLKIDTTAAAGSRAQLFKAGSAVTVNTIFTEITASAAVDSTMTNWTRNVLYLGGEAGSVGSAYLTGKDYYLALYTSLSTISTNASNLATNDDADPNGGGTITPTGQAATTAQGTAAPAISPALTGQAATSAGGTAAPGVAPALTGQAATSARGTPSPSVTVALTGLAATAQQGTVTVPGGTLLTGQQATTAQGTPAPSVTVALSGLAASVAGGALAGATAPPLQGRAVSVAGGSLAPSLSVNMTGKSASAFGGFVSLPLPPWPFKPPYTADVGSYATTVTVGAQQLTVTPDT